MKINEVINPYDDPGSKSAMIDNLYEYSIIQEIYDTYEELTKITDNFVILPYELIDDDRIYEIQFILNKLLPLVSHYSKQSYAKQMVEQMALYFQS